MKKLRDVDVAARELLRVRRARAADEARADPVAAAAEPRLRRRAARGVLRRSSRATTAEAARARHAARRAARRPSSGRRPTPTGRCGTRWRSGTPASRRPQFIDAAAQARHRAGRRRHRRQVAVHGGRDRRLRLRAAARRRRSCTPAATTTTALDRWAARVRVWAAGGTRRVRALARPAEPATGATCSSTSTTTSRCARPSTRSRWAAAGHDIAGRRSAPVASLLTSRTGPCARWVTAARRDALMRSGESWSFTRGGGAGRWALRGRDTVSA